MKAIIERHNKHSRDDVKSIRGSLSKDVLESRLQLRQMKGKDIGGLTLEELQNLEKALEIGLCRVLTRKGQQMVGEIKELQHKSRKIVGSSPPAFLRLTRGRSTGAKLMEENDLLKRSSPIICRSKQIGSSSSRKQTADCDSATGKNGQSSESIKNALDSGPPHDCGDCSDTSLRLGLSSNFGKRLGLFLSPNQVISADNKSFFLIAIA
ncbi:unnamed protein product [Spirodela intermedia]|uniref:K-box domain-containing protein n=1 Tax=Spirodela intermedia TaxID=51605 RepID=A0A7I8J2A6_SPIIN|nr:unnamed protein product [Spirodela intermedia]CAA6664354.1 unnamed protein product [Spirodela intermedia]